MNSYCHKQTILKIAINMKNLFQLGVIPVSMLFCASEGIYLNANQPQCNNVTDGVGNFVKRNPTLGINTEFTSASK